MHLAHEIVHFAHGRGGLVNHDIDSVIDQVEIVIGDDASDFDDDMTVGFEARHLKIDPNQTVVIYRARHRVTLQDHLTCTAMARRNDALEMVGRRVLLRSLRAEDWDAWREIRERGRQWLEVWEPSLEPGAPDPVVHRDAFRNRCSAWDRQRQFDAAYGFGLFLRDGRLVGEISLGSVQRGPFQTAYVGYWIDEMFAGQSLIPEGIVVLMGHSFDVLGLHRLEAAIVPRNLASRRVVEKLGLRSEGIAERFLQIQGVYEDHIRYAITVEEYRSRESELKARFA